MKTVVEQMGDVLAASKARSEAIAIAVVHVETARPLATSEAGPASFVAALAGIDCLEVSWGEVVDDVLIQRWVQLKCSCGGHAAHVFKLRGPWMLLVLMGLGPGHRSTTILRVYESYHGTVEVLDRYLAQLEADPPPRHPRGGGGGGAAPAELGIPVWWVRQRN
jgi:hypothetical protein